MNKNTVILVVLIAVVGFWMWWSYVPHISPINPDEIDNRQVQSQVTAGGETFSGLVTAYDTGCFADGVCSISIDDTRVILLRNDIVGEQPLGELRGVESMGDLEYKIGSRADVYAALTELGEYTLYGDSDFFVEIQ